MEQTKYVKFPLAGIIQHGLKQENGRISELGYFIAKTKDSSMNPFVDKFHSLYEKQTKIKIRIFDENPFSIKLAKYNTGGLVCYCMENEKIGKEKVKNIWQNKECLETCEHRQFIDDKKPACNREGLLKFLLPGVNEDRIWIMRIKGHNSIENIENYFNTQKYLGNSVKGDYELVLNKQKTERKSDGKVFYNFILNIFKIENINSIHTSNISKINSSIPTKEINTVQTKEKEQVAVKSQTKNTETVENNNSNIQTTIIPEEQKKEEKKTTKKTTTKKETKKQTDKTNTEKETEKNEFENYHVFLETVPTIVEKDGKKINYTAAKFVNYDDIEIEAIINNELAKELEDCQLGTQIILEFMEAANRKWVKNYEFVEKQLKKVA